MARTLAENWEEMPSWSRGKSGHMNSQNSIMLEDYEESIFIDPEDKEFKETIRTARKKLETPVAPAMPCKTSEKQSAWGDSWWIQWDQIKTCVYFGIQWNHKTAYGKSLPNPHKYQGDNSLQHYNLVHKCISYASSHENSRSNGSSGYGMGKTGKDSGVETWQMSEVRKRWSTKQGRKAKKFILHHWWTYVIWKMLNWRQKVRVVLQNDIVKDDSGSYAVSISVQIPKEFELKQLRRGWSWAKRWKGQLCRSSDNSSWTRIIWNRWRTNRVRVGMFSQDLQHWKFLGRS